MRVKMPDITKCPENDKTVIFIAPVERQKKLIFKVGDKGVKLVSMTNGQQILPKYVWMHKLLTWMKGASLLEGTETVQLTLLNEATGTIRQISFADALELLEDISLANL